MASEEDPKTIKEAVAFFEEHFGYIYAQLKDADFSVAVKFNKGKQNLLVLVLQNLIMHFKRPANRSFRAWNIQSAIQFTSNPTGDDTAAPDESSRSPRAGSLEASTAKLTVLTPSQDNTAVPNETPCRSRA